MTIKHATPSGTNANARPEDATTSRRPYRAPQLRHLGSVRELTLGVSGGFDDVGAGMMVTP